MSKTVLEAVAYSWGVRPLPPNDFTLSKCDTRFDSSSSQEAIKDKVLSGA